MKNNYVIQNMDMIAGIEMNALVAVNIMEIDVKHDWHWKHTTKNYSDDISAAWEVVEKLKKIGWSLSIIEHAEPAGDYVVEIWRRDLVGDEDKIFVFRAETAPLAICRAALSVVPANVGGV